MSVVIIATATTTLDPQLSRTKVRARFGGLRCIKLTTLAILGASVLATSLPNSLGDDGVGMSGVTKEGSGFGSRMICSLVRQLRGTVTWRDGSPGTIVEIPFPTNDGSGTADAT